MLVHRGLPRAVFVIAVICLAVAVVVATGLVGRVALGPMSWNCSTKSMRLVPPAVSGLRYLMLKTCSLRGRLSLTSCCSHFFGVFVTVTVPDASIRCAEYISGRRARRRFRFLRAILHQLFNLISP